MLLSQGMDVINKSGTEHKYIVTICIWQVVRSELIHRRIHETIVYSREPVCEHTCAAGFM